VPPKTWIALGVAAMAVVLAVAIFFGTRDPRGTVISRSRSADGRFEVVIYEKTPSFPMQSPFAYTFHAVERAAPSDKDTMTIDNDSAQLSDFVVTWPSTTSASVKFNGGKREATFDFSSNRRVWTVAH
jgi:hypothetical protein